MACTLLPKRFWERLAAFQDLFGAVWNVVGAFGSVLEAFGDVDGLDEFLVLLLFLLLLLLTSPRTTFPKPWPGGMRVSD